MASIDIDTVMLNVVGVGPQKTGTTWLYFCLLNHPNLSFPRGVKETFFLDRRYEKGWSWYWSHFEKENNGNLYLEIAPTYFDSEDAVRRLQEHNYKCKIIVSLRNPVDRTFSHYLHEVKKGRLACSFNDAIKQMPRLINASRYNLYLPNWIRSFCSDNVLVVFQEDIGNNPGEVWWKVCRFLGIDHTPLPRIGNSRVNEASLPRYPGLAFFTTKATDYLRDAGLYRAIELGKTLGLKQFIYESSSRQLPVMGVDVREKLRQEFETTILYIESLLGSVPLSWRKT